MKKHLTIFFVLIAVNAFAQKDTTTHYTRHANYERHSIIAGGSIGFIDAYRNNYSLPPGFEKSNTSGFIPVYFKLEYAAAKNISIAALLGYDAFLYNYKQDYIGNNGAFTRYVTNNTRIISGGLIALYHLGKVLPTKHLDPYIGIGLSLNNIRYDAQPQGDSTVVKFDHTVSPYLKAGARYYITSVFSAFADVGYDQHTLFDLGFSCRFFRRDNK